MTTILQINKLNYQIDETKKFTNLNLDIKKGDFVSIIAPNRSGKTTLTKLLCAIIPTTNVIQIENIILNKKNVLKYIEQIGVVSNFLNVFLTKKVKDELILSLKNLGYNEYKINKRLTKMASFFEIENILNKNIKALSKNEINKLKIIISLMHEPKILILDDAFNNLDKDTLLFMLKKLKELNQEGLTIVNITSNLNTIYNSNLIYLLNDYKISLIGNLEETFSMDNYLKKIGLELPFIIDLSIKLKFYDLIDKIYYDLDSLEDNLWK